MTNLVEEWVCPQCGEPFVVTPEQAAIHFHLCTSCQQWIDDHPNGITPEEREALDNYEGTGL